MRGQADDLGGGVFKKRLNRNMHHSIVLARGGNLWIYQYIYAKKDRANIGDNDLEDFRVLAKAYGKLTEGQIAQLVDDKDLIEVRYAEKT